MNALAREGWRLSNSAPISWQAAGNHLKRFYAIIYTFERLAVENEEEDCMAEQRSVDGKLIEIFLRTYTGNRDAKFDNAFDKWYDEQKIIHNVSSNVALLAALNKKP